MAINDRAIFKAAMERTFLKGTFGFKDRRVLREAMDSPYLLELLHDAVQDQLPEPATVGEWGDGTILTIILDRIGKWVQWIIEHRDEIVDFLKKILEVIDALF